MESNTNTDSQQIDGVLRRLADALRRIAAAPAEENSHRDFFGLLYPLMSMTGLEVPRRVLGLWFDACCPEGSRIEAVDRLAKASHDPAVPRFASMTMIQTGFVDEAVRAFSHSCFDGVGKPASDRLAAVAAKFTDLAVTYDAIPTQDTTATQFADFLAETVRIPPTAVALDVGCGTGLVGQWLRPRVAVLDGIDISAEMIAQARQKEVYDRLIVGEAGEEMAQAERRERYDLVLCSWVLFYVPDLNPIFQGAASALAPGGRVALSVYPCDDAQDHRHKDGDIEFAHSRLYLRRLARQNGLIEDRIEIRPLNVYPGYYAVFSKA